jgi:hypothetical protein
MTRIKSIWRTGNLVLITLVGWLVAHGVALAQRGAAGAAETPTPGGGPSSYMLPYMITVVFIGLGIFVICRPTHRRDRARPEEYTSIIDDGTLSED